MRLNRLKEGRIAGVLTASSSCLFCSVLVLSLSSAVRQIPEDVVRATLFLSRSKVLVGETLKIAVQVKLRKTWHIHADKVADDSLIPASLTIEKQEGLKILEIAYPKPTREKYEYAESSLAVFEGDILIGARLQFSPNVPPGPRDLKVTFRCQACDNRSCLPPETIKLSAKVDIVVSGAPATEDNAAVFKKIAFKESK